MADTIRRVKASGRYSDNAVLYRMNAQSNAVERMLVKCGIPYRVYGGMRFYDRKEIKDVTSTWPSSTTTTICSASKG